MTTPREQRPAPAAAALLQIIGASLQRRVSKLVGKPLFWVLSLGLLFLVPMGRTMALSVPEPPKLNLPLPPFELTNEQGEPYGLDDLLGRVWVADFMFTTCPTVCPKLTQRMAQIQQRGRNLGEAFHLVSFTVDPETDTPAVLAAYAQSFHANPRRWSFVTGPLGDLEKTVVKGFKIAMGKEESAPGSGIFGIFHGEKLVLVDPKGSIRGYYDADDEGIDRLMHDINIIVNVR